MNGVQLFLLAFCLTLIEVINTLLVGYAGMLVFCEYFSIFRTYIFCNLNLWASNQYKTPNNVKKIRLLSF